MKRKLNLFLLTILLVGNVFSQENTSMIRIGNSTTTSNQGCGFAGWYGFTWTAHMYSAVELSDLDAGSEIVSLSYFFAENNYVGQSIGVKMWLKEMEANGISSSIIWRDLKSDATLVFEGSFSPPSNDWGVLILDEPYQYGGGNLVVIMESVGCTPSGGCSRKTYVTDLGYSSTKAWSFYKDSSSPDSTASLYQLSMMFNSNSHNRADVRIYFDNSGISCPSVTGLAVSEITSDGAIVTWTGADNSSEYVVQCKTTAQAWDDENVQIYNVTDTFVDLSGMLNPITTYNVRVSNKCGTDMSMWRSVTFNTSCSNIVSLPFFWDFETYDLATRLPNCWTKNTSASSEPYCYQTTHSHGGNYCLRFYNTRRYAILPPVDTDIYPISSLQLRFTCYKGVSNTVVAVGVMTDPTDTSTFVLVDTVANYCDVVGDFNENLIASLASYTGNGQYIALAMHESSDGLFIHLDDLTLEESPSCDYPENTRNVAVRAMDADIAWETDAPYIDLYYKENEAVEWIGLSNVSLNEEGFYTLTDLSPTTDYLWYVSRDCGDGSVAASAVMSFSTPCVGIDSLPVFWDFENDNTSGTPSYPLPACWSRNSTSHPFVSSYATGGAYSGEKCLYQYHFYGNCAILPPLNTDALSWDNLMISFYAKTSSPAGNTLKIGVMTDPMIADSFVEVGVADLTNNYVLHEIPLTSYQGDGVYIVLKFANNDSYGTYVDDVMLSEIPPCSRPNLLTASVRDVSAVLSWFSTGTIFNLYYKAASDTSYTGILGVELDNDGNFVLADLLPSTTYEWYVEGVCDGDFIITSSVHSFSTLCITATAPYMEDFNSGQTMPECWKHYKNFTSDVFGGEQLSETTSVGWKFTNTHVFGQYHAAINVYGTEKRHWLVSRDIDISGLEEPVLTFNLALTQFNSTAPIANPNGQADDKFMVMISTDYGATWSANNATLWDNSGNGNYVYNDISHTGDSVVIPLTSYEGQTIRIAFYAESTVNNGDNDLHIDNVFVGEAQHGGSVVTEPSVVTEAVSNITQTSATLHARISDAGNQPIIALGFEWKASGEGPFAEVTVSGSDNFSCELTGLVAATSYTCRAFARTETSTSFGDEVTFLTLDEETDTCSTPINLSVVDITQYSSKVVWTAGGSETAWNVQHRSQSESQWSDTVVVTNSRTFNDLMPNTHYEVRVRAICDTDNYSEFVDVQFTTEGVGIGSVELSQDISLIPNPCDNFIELHIKDSKSVNEAYLFNAFGQMIRKIELKDNTTRVDMGGLAPGMYFVRVTVAGHTFTKKFIRK